ncbi:hypothetical protein KM043_003191 [Ampulex compressa]|nr:hypothetical protein KM043_003191 [Ampulex compressa]
MRPGGSPSAGGSWPGERKLRSWLCGSWLRAGSGELLRFSPKGDPRDLLASLGRRWELVCQEATGGRPSKNKRPRTPPWTLEPSSRLPAGHEASPP